LWLRRRRYLFLSGILERGSKEMKTIFTFLIVLVTALVSTANAQQIISSAHAIRPCELTYSTPLTPGIPYGIEVRGYCGVPYNASAVFLSLKAGNSPKGKFWLYPYGETHANSQMNYQDAVSPDPVSGHALVRLGGGSYESTNMWIEATSAVNASVIVEGYIVDVVVDCGCQ